MNQRTDIERIFFRSNLLKLARVGFALVAGWGRFSVEEKPSQV
jgi:hypothetical protein